MRKSRHSVSLGTFGLAFAVVPSPVWPQGDACDVGAVETEVAP